LGEGRARRGALGRYPVTEIGLLGELGGEFTGFEDGLPPIGVSSKPSHSIGHNSAMPAWRGSAYALVAAPGRFDLVVTRFGPGLDLGMVECLWCGGAPMAASIPRWSL
jgi:hypothetical protein